MQQDNTPPLTSSNEARALLERLLRMQQQQQQQQRPQQQQPQRPTTLDRAGRQGINAALLSMHPSSSQATNAPSMSAGPGLLPGRIDVAPQRPPLVVNTTAFPGTPVALSRPPLAGMMAAPVSQPSPSTPTLSTTMSNVPSMSSKKARQTKSQKPTPAPPRQMSVLTIEEQENYQETFTRVQRQVQKDQRGVVFPDRSPFRDVKDMTSRLLSYHVLQETRDFPNVNSKELFDQKQNELLQRTDGLLSRYTIIQDRLTRDSILVAKKKIETLLELDAAHLAPERLATEL